MSIEYVKGDKSNQEESHKGKSPSKTTNVRTNDESNDANKQKHPYISTIKEGTPRGNLPSKGTMKRKINEMLVFHKKDISFSVNIPSRTMLGF